MTERLTDEQLLYLLKQVDIQAMRIPSGVRKLADLICEQLLQNLVEYGTYREDEGYKRGKAERKVGMAEVPEGYVAVPRFLAENHRNLTDVPRYQRILDDCLAAGGAPHEGEAGTTDYMKEVKRLLVQYENAYVGAIDMSVVQARAALLEHIQGLHALCEEMGKALGELVQLEADGKHADECAIEVWEQSSAALAKWKESKCTNT